MTLGSRRRRRLAVVAVVVLVVVIVGAAMVGIDLLEAAIEGPGPVATPSAGPTVSPAAVSIRGSTPPSAAEPSRLSSPVPSPTPAVSPSPVPSPTPATTSSASPRHRASPAPTGPAGFEVRETIVAMGFPLPAGSGYRYGDGWRARRTGVVYQYNLIRGIAPDGRLLRAHDGTDLLVPSGTLVVSPWDGILVDPRRLWMPWDPARYGKVVVIRSTEPTSPGYVVLLAHLSRQSVAVGRTVRRGQIVGRTGRTGNTAGTPPHLHIEIHAPFKIRYGYAGVHRELDVFDIGPSLRAADPNAR